jgi:putative redox protein
LPRHTASLIYETRRLYLNSPKFIFLDGLQLLWYLALGLPLFDNIIIQRKVCKKITINEETDIMEMIIDFPGGSRVDAHFHNFTVATDQPPVASAPSPFEVFLSSIGTCAGIYVLGFCMQRNLPTAGIRILERISHDSQTGMLEQVGLEIQVPESFPEKYHAALIRSAEQCAVKKTIEKPLRFDITTRVV